MNESSLVIQTSFLGDTVLTTPLIAELAKRGPVDVVTTPASAGLLANHPGIRSVIPYDKRRADSGVRGFLRLAGRLRQFRYDAAYLAQASLRSAALALAAGASRRIGFSTAPGRLLYTTRVEYREDLHHAARLLSLAKPPDEIRGESDFRPHLYPGISERGAVDRLLALHDALTDAPLVALAPASIWGTKRWPYYSELARELAPSARVIVLGSADDVPLAAEVCAAVGTDGGAINAAGTLTLLGSAELIRRCSVLVTNDSAPQHLASAVDTPTVAIFGPTVPAFGFGPLARRSSTIGLDALACRPCDRHGPRRCPLGHWRCMREITPRDVAARVLDILQ
jgi:lipopolysaccharide heptosyltransferase II